MRCVQASERRLKTLERKAKFGSARCNYWGTESLMVGELMVDGGQTVKRKTITCFSWR